MDGVSFDWLMSAKVWGWIYSRHGAVGVAGLAVARGIGVLPHGALLLFNPAGALGHTHVPVLNILALLALLRPLWTPQGKAGSIANRCVKTHRYPRG